MPSEMKAALRCKLLTLLNTVNTVFIGYNITVYADYATQTTNNANAAFIAFTAYTAFNACTVVLGCIGKYWAGLNLTGLQWSGGLHLAILGFGGMYWAVHGCTVLENSFTGLYWAKLGYTWMTGLRWLKLVIWLMWFTGFRRLIGLTQRV